MDSITASVSDQFFREMARSACLMHVTVVRVVHAWSCVTEIGVLLSRLGFSRALLEDGDPRDVSPLLQAGLILESLEEVKEAAVR